MDQYIHRILIFIIERQSLLSTSRLLTVLPNKTTAAVSFSYKTIKHLLKFDALYTKLRTQEALPYQVGLSTIVRNTKHQSLSHVLGTLKPQICTNINIIREIVNFQEN